MYRYWTVCPNLISSESEAGTCLAIVMFDWHDVGLVVFDVDGTLYDQRPVRTAMLRDLVFDAVRSGSLRTIRVLREFRKIREQLADDQVGGFLSIQYERTSARTGVPEKEIERIVARWMEELPLRYIRKARYAHLDRVFASLRAKGKVIAIWSDYPAIAKVEALELEADHICSAYDLDVATLKPDPKGLLRIIDRLGFTPEETIMIGDRPERDGEAARRAGVQALILSSPPNQKSPASFTGYGDHPFSLLDSDRRKKTSHLHTFNPGLSEMDRL